ncbi:hypothetical protein EQO05_11870 [Methanosarcina sp. MSH10X1]|uniref:hypothetical protein n=1 Tax=Methanosarcina sp. MSH10X1 TaxID=2507075 RepID=UPI000FFB611A|nr:hypothetical protein [Methanosarcina sp. MSH10X1]RXA17585.1 hypothetical protein EQO05_11870 [Methanosarcina sp. MSH10X1]
MKKEIRNEERDKEKGKKKKYRRLKIFFLFRKNVSGFGGTRKLWHSHVPQLSGTFFMHLQGFGVEKISAYQA